MKRLFMFSISISFGIVCMIVNVSPSSAAMFHEIEFPDGAVSFADSVVSYDPVIKNGQPTESYRNALEALGIPDYQEGPGIDYVSLGDGGSITLQFTDNSLTGSGDNTPDLWIFEIGPDVEDTFVEISKNNVSWFDVGKVFGSTSGIDIDASGFGTNDFISYVRLTDDTNEGNQSGNTVGGDIDAIGAISSAPPVPLPGAVWLLGSGLIGLMGLRKKLLQRDA